MFFLTLLGSQKLFLQPRSSYKGGRHGAHLQRSPRLCGWSAALRRCAGSPRSVCKRVGSRSGRSRCAHISNRSRGSAERTGKLCPHNTIKQRHRHLEKAPSDTNSLLMLRTARQFLKMWTVCFFPPLQETSFRWKSKEKKPADARHLDRLPQAWMEERPWLTKVAAWQNHKNKLWGAQTRREHWVQH